MSDGPTTFPPCSDAELLHVIANPLTWGEKQEIRDLALNAADEFETAAQHAFAELKLSMPARMALLEALYEVEGVRAFGSALEKRG